MSDAMPKKIIKKTKIKIVPILVLIFALLFGYFLVKYLLSIKIQNIYITGNKYLNDEYIIEKAGLKDYPSILKTMSFNVRELLLDDSFINEAKVNKSLFGTIEIDVSENSVLFYKEYDKMYVLSNLEEVSNIPFTFSPVRVINYIPDNVYKTFTNKYIEIKDDVKDKISEIKYDPSEYDNNRFLFYMVDGNYVYVTSLKLDSLNYYNEIYPTLDNKKGILYLDSGNHFVEF